MAIEIERRFLVKNEDWRSKVILSEDFSQAYLNSNSDELAIRVRIIDTNKASEMKRTWRVDNQSIGTPEILDYVISDTVNGYSRPEIISAIIFHSNQGNVVFEVSDSDNQSDKREIIIR